MDISAEIAAIQAASQGSELRQPLVGALNKLNSGSLPAVTASDAGKILKVGANGWEVGEKSGYMPVPTATKQITENGTHNVTDYASVVVNVQGGSSPVIEALTVTQNGVYYPQTGVDGFSPVIVSVSGGAISQVYFELTPESIVSNYSGTCVLYGNHAIIDIRVSFSSTSGSNIPIFTVPTNCKPAGIYYGMVGNGGNVSFKPTITIKPDGKIYAGALQSYLFIHLEWDVADEIIQTLSLSSDVSSKIGEIAVCNKYASMSIDLSMLAGSNQWQDLFTIPETVRPNIIMKPFIYTLDNNKYIRDSNYDTVSGAVSMWRSVNDYDRFLHIQASWLISE